MIKLPKKVDRIVMTNEPLDLTPALLLRAYANGIFPMAEHRDDPEVFWVDPRRRGVIPLDGFHISRSLARRIRRGMFEVRSDTVFEQVVDACADRAETWINPEIRALYLALHNLGHAHSIEVWENDVLVGGVYGIAIGGVFCGESMFSRRTDASKIALAYLVDHLKRCGFVLLDTQFITDHLASLGGIEISRAEYRRQLFNALEIKADFLRYPVGDRPYLILQRNSQTS